MNTAPDSAGTCGKYPLLSCAGDLALKIEELEEASNIEVHLPYRQMS